MTKKSLYVKYTEKEMCNLWSKVAHINCSILWIILWPIIICIFLTIICKKTLRLIQSSLWKSNSYNFHNNWASTRWKITKKQNK